MYCVFGQALPISLSVSLLFSKCEMPWALGLVHNRTCPANLMWIISTHFLAALPPFLCELLKLSLGTFWTRAAVLTVGETSPTDASGLKGSERARGEALHMMVTMMRLVPIHMPRNPITYPKFPDQGTRNVEEGVNSTHHPPWGWGKGDEGRRNYSKWQRMMMGVPIAIWAVEERARWDYTPPPP